jgi:phytol kinase
MSIMFFPPPPFKRMTRLIYRETGKPALPKYTLFEQIGFSPPLPVYNSLRACFNRETLNPIDGDKMNPFLALIITFAVAMVELRLLDMLAQRGWIESHLSRKLIHILTGPLFVLCWLLYPDLWYSRWLAALVPFAITVQFALIGLGVMKDEASVKAMSRSGDRREILRGPLFYGIVFVVMTLVFWKSSPVGMLALMLMCGGDGMADILGRGVKSPKLHWSKDKTVAGSLGMLLGGWFLAAFILFIFVHAGIFPGPFTAYLLPISVIALAGMLVESLPLKDVDNITVTLVAVLLGLLFF